MEVESKIVNCPFSYVCKQNWEELPETPNPKIKHSTMCATNVHWVEDVAELAEAKLQERYVAFELGMNEISIPLLGLR